MKILFYSDVAEYGGHEMLTVDAVRYLSSLPNCSLHFVLYSGNSRLLKRLKEVKASNGQLEIHTVEFRSRSGQAIRSLVSFGNLFKLNKLFHRIAPDVIVVCQGRIEACSLGLVAAKRAGIHLISYIPMAHAVSTSGRKFLAGMRDKINRYYYRLPDNFITISEASKAQLLAQGVTSRITVVSNGVRLGRFDKAKGSELRRKLGFRDSDYVVAIIGRIHFHQKGQDTALSALHENSSRLANIRVLVVGSGPDERRMAIMIQSLDLQDRVTTMAWREETEDIYAAIDMLLIPSHFEGVPLVMLEAMGHGVPIVASNIDGMSEMLPGDWCFYSGDRAGLIDTVLRVKEADNQQNLDKYRTAVRRENTTLRFQQRFAEAISRLSEQSIGGIISRNTGSYHATK